MDCLQYAHENNCPWGERTCERAAEKGHVECLRYAHENGCLWDVNTCTYAAENGKVGCLRYAYENDCPIDQTIMEHEYLTFDVK